MLTADHFVKKLNLIRHIEGGYYAQFYKSDKDVKPLDKIYNDEIRSAGTSIYFLLEKEDFSALHVLKSDEVWNHHIGSPVVLHILDPRTKEYTKRLLGSPFDKEGNHIQDAELNITIKAGQYFAAEVLDKDAFTLVTCNCNPGFEYQDFRLCTTKELEFTFPKHASCLSKFIREMEPSEEKSVDFDVRLTK